MNKSTIKILLLGWLCLPHLFIYLLCKERDTVTYDLKRWCVAAKTPFQKVINTKKGTYLTLIYLLVNFPEFRNVFYLRVGFLRIFLLYLPPLSSLYIKMKSKDFGAGTFIQHGYSTGIAAKHIGKDCWINQMVSIGYTGSKSLGSGNPWIEDNVRISTGARVYGPVKVGKNSTIGVNAVVLKNVPDNTVVIPSPTMILYKDGERVNERL